MKSLLGLLGIHDWKFSSKSHDSDRYCSRCSKYQSASYDMATGETMYQ